MTSIFLHGVQLWASIGASRRRLAIDKRAVPPGPPGSSNGRNSTIACRAQQGAEQAQIIPLRPGNLISGPASGQSHDGR